MRVDGRLSEQLRPTRITPNYTMHAEGAVLVEAGGYDAVDAGDVATGLMALTDGLWLDLLLTPTRFDRNGARRVCLAFLMGMFPRHFTGRADDGGLDAKGDAVSAA